MTTIFLLNAISSLLATAGIGCLLVTGSRRAARQAIVAPVHVTVSTTRPLPRT
jgi:hypothetical protein